MTMNSPKVWGHHVGLTTWVSLFGYPHDRCTIGTLNYHQMWGTVEGAGNHIKSVKKSLIGMDTIFVCTLSILSVLNLHKSNFMQFAASKMFRVQLHLMLAYVYISPLLIGYCVLCMFGCLQKNSQQHLGYKYSNDWRCLPRKSRATVVSTGTSGKNNQKRKIE